MEENNITKEIINSEHKIEDPTIQFLLNSNNTFYGKKPPKKSLTINEEDKEFYKGRIINTIKELLNNEVKDPYINEDIKQTFSIFIKLLIGYYKMDDKHDLYQEEYSDFIQKNELKKECSEDTIIENVEIKNINNCLFNSRINKKNDTANLRDFLNITKTSSENNQEEPYLPIVKNPNIRDTKFKTKGL